MIKKNYLIIRMVILLCLILITCSITVKSQEKKNNQKLNEYYNNVEEEYELELRELLKKEGYSNSGITITCILNEEQSREYQVMIHHRRITQLNLLKKEQLIRKIETIPFIEEASIYHEFLTVN